MTNDLQSFLLPAVTAGEDWKGLELSVLRLLEHLGWKNLQYIGRSGDKGADVLGVWYDKRLQRNVSYVFQVKAVTEGNYVSVPAITQALSAQSYYEADRVVVVTNGTFTNSAIRRCELVNHDGAHVELWNGTTLKQFLARCKEESAARRIPRIDYQEGLISKCTQMYAQGSKRAFLVVATGLGKTLMAAEVTRRLWEGQGVRKILVLCHAVELSVQLQKSFWAQLGKRIPTQLFFGGDIPVPIDGITFGLYQSLFNNLGGITPDAFDLIIVDEAHHAWAANFASCIHRLRPKFLLGMTATPWRGDGRDLELMFGSPVAKLSLVDGMRMGHLAKVDYRVMCDNIKWDEIPRLARKKLSIRKLNKTLFVPQRDDAIVAKILDVARAIDRPKIAVFSASIQHAEKFSQLLNASGIKTGVVSSKDRPAAHKTLLNFAADRLDAIASVDILNEGIDVPDINIVVFLRATHSRRIFVQQLGRGLRINPSKKNVVVLDFVTDIRRLSAITELDKEAKAPLKPGEIEIVNLRDGLVTFDNRSAQMFVEAWLNDVGSFQDEDDSAQLTFPDIEEVIHE